MCCDCNIFLFDPPEFVYFYILRKKTQPIFLQIMQE